jgi:hypothetical protein
MCRHNPIAISGTGSAKSCIRLSVGRNTRMDKWLENLAGDDPLDGHGPRPVNQPRSPHHCSQGVSS